MAEVDSIVGHIETQVQLGRNKDVVIAEQADLLLDTFSKLKGITLDTVNAVAGQAAHRDRKHSPGLPLAIHVGPAGNFVCMRMAMGTFSSIYLVSCSSQMPISGISGATCQHMLLRLHRPVLMWRNLGNRFHTRASGMRQYTPFP